MTSTQRALRFSVRDVREPRTRCLRTPTPSPRAALQFRVLTLAVSSHSQEREDVPAVVEPQPEHPVIGGDPGASAQDNGAMPARGTVATPERAAPVLPAPADEASVAAILAADAAALPVPLESSRRAARARVVEPVRPRKWLALAVRFLAEKRFARLRSRALLKSYESVRAAAPQLAGRELYARVVIESGFEPKDAQVV